MRTSTAKPNDYLERILKTRVHDVAIESPLDLAPGLSRRLGNRLLLKREDLQPVFSFKIQGAYNKMASLPPSKVSRGVIAARAGNHAQGVALAAHHDDERLYRFEFPERPGALMKFLNSVRGDWNISLFHYRNYRADYGRVLAGIQVPPHGDGEL